MRLFYLGYILVFCSFIGSLQGSILDVMENRCIFHGDLDQETTRSGVLNFQGKKSSKILLMDTGVFDVQAKIEAGYEEIYALLIEPSWIHSEKVKRFIKKNHALFKKIFTFDAELLSLDKEKFVFIHPCGSITVTDYKVFPKSKMLAMQLSKKRGHHEYDLRHYVAKKFRKVFSAIKPASISLPFMDDFFNDFRYVVAIENCKEPNYFTEKVTTCFLTGTVPIYRGCPNLGDFYNMKGVIVFDTPSDLKKILLNLSEEDYLSRMDAIQENFQIAYKKHLIDHPNNGPFPKEYFAKILDHIFSTDGVLQKNGLHP